MIESCRANVLEHCRAPPDHTGSVSVSGFTPSLSQQFYTEHRKIKKRYLSYDVAVIEWITSCHKNRMTTHIIILWQVHVASLTMSMSAMHFLLYIKFVLNAIKSNFKWSYDKQNLTLVVVSNEIYDTRQRLVS